MWTLKGMNLQEGYLLVLASRIHYFWDCRFSLSNIHLFREVGRIETLLKILGIYSFDSLL